MSRQDQAQARRAAARVFARGNRCAAAIGIAGLIIGAAGPALAQDALPPDANQAEIIVEFQRLLDEYQVLQAQAADTPEQRRQLMTDLGGLIQRLEALVARSGGQPDILLIEALAHSRVAGLLLDERREADQQFQALRRELEAAPRDDVSRQLAELSTRRSELATRTASEFDRFTSALRDALERAETIRATRQSSLIRGVVLAQTAIVKDRAIEAAQDARDLGGQAAEPAEANVQVGDMRALLDDARERLHEYLQATPRENGLEWIRGQFYLGVVEYRGSLRQREPGQPYYTEVDPGRIDMFASAADRFASLSDPQAVREIVGQENEIAQQAYLQSTFKQSQYEFEDVGNFYAATSNLYLGLIEAVHPKYDELGADAARRRQEAALPLLNRALAYDRAGEARGIPSLTSNTIPVSYEKVTRNLAQAVEAAVLRPAPLNDLTLTFGVTTMYDTNVILLGRNTEPPQDKQRRRDFRAGAVARLNYVLDLEAVAPEDEFLRKWQVSFDGRAAPLWNARIHDFNEQFYGGGVNLRYEIIGPEAKVPNLDGLYFHTRYDYDYLLLGNNGFLRTHLIQPSFQAIAFDGVVDTSLYFTYEDRNYLETLRDTRFDRDGNYFSWGSDTVLDLEKWVNAERLYGKDRVWGFAAPMERDPDYVRAMTLTGGIAFTTNSTQGSEFDYSSQIIRGAFAFPLPYGVDFSGRALFEWQDYRGGSLVDNDRQGRKDFIQEYGLRLERRFYVTQNYDPAYQHIDPLNLCRVVMTVFGDVAFTIDDSNVRDRLGQSIYEYNRVIYSAGVRFDIN